ncbi:SDR family NAD(P)-dependent oxidoreductase [Euzebya pacifica]|uniref:SDR family NAD(P)-dependent oxidoreductase n=1 Tax=Euzebya pacifica TaxID=1608957 RepID=UPI000DF815F0|nr:SDR family NAD(P)-dependent oxidoreductase [Euzebya pacifica]
MKLDGKVAFVTGAGRGIGEAIAMRLAQDGATVYAADMDEATAKQTAKHILADGLKAKAVTLDVTDLEAVKDAIATVAEAEGGLDVLVNNAGWDQLEPFVRSEPATWQKVIAINYLGVIHTTHSALPGMLERGSGRIVNVGSDAGRVGSKGEAVYSGAKGAVIAFSKTVAREVARDGVGVNVVCPGPTETPLVMEQVADNERLLKALERSIPLGRMGRPEEVAHAVAFLASEEAGFITGQTLSVSGGLTMS